MLGVFLACAKETTSPPTANTTAAPRDVDVGYDFGFPRTFKLPSALVATPFDQRIDDQGTIVAPSIRVERPSEAMQAIVEGFPDCRITGIGLYRRAAQPLRLVLVDARTKGTLARAQLAEGADPAILLAMQRVVTDEPTAVAIYSVRSGSLVLEFAYSTTGSDAHFRSYDDESGFTEYSWYADTQPTGASKVIRTWSLNGPFTDYFAEVLFEEGDLSGHKWSVGPANPSPDGYLDEVLDLPLNLWPKAVWCLVLEAA